MLGEKVQMWIDKLKIAIIQKDTGALDVLLDTMPQSLTAKEAQEAMYLFAEALELLYTLKDETSTSMQQLKRNINFLKSTRPNSAYKLDITS